MFSGHGHGHGEALPRNERDADAQGENQEQEETQPQQAQRAPSLMGAVGGGPRPVLAGNRFANARQAAAAAVARMSQIRESGEWSSGAINAMRDSSQEPVSSRRLPLSQSHEGGSEVDQDTPRGVEGSQRSIVGVMPRQDGQEP